jgi:hypothetical protein
MNNSTIIIRIHFAVTLFQHIGIIAMVYYEMAQHSDLVLLTRERKSSYLRCLFEDVEEVEENIRASKRIRDASIF